jgi:membrane associated rhomboid family serine protease
VPIIGASGAIAATIGAYVALYPRAQILTMVFPPFLLWLPAWLVAGGWALLQFVATWRSVFAPAALDGSVAYVAHVVGFLAGVAVIGLLADRRNPDYPGLRGP